MTNILAWLANWVDRWFGGECRDDPKQSRAMRASWAKAAEELGLRHTIGAITFEDRIEGEVEGYLVEVTYVANFEVQKPETIIRVRSGEFPMGLSIFDSKTLLGIYEENAGAHGSLIAEEKSWLCGEQMGCGISGNHRELCYVQHWQMCEPADIVFVCVAMMKTIRCLDPDRTKFQR